MKSITTIYVKKCIGSMLLFASCYLYPHFASSQTGSVSSPYTELGMARNVPSAGVYYFNLTGTTFSTYVDANGWVQVAIDFGNGVGNLPQGTSLTNGSRGILNTTALSKLTTATEARLSSSTGNLDVATTNATILTRITQNYILSRGAVDNTINNGWTGTNVNNTQFSGCCGCTQSNTDLSAVVFHACGNGSGFHWVPMADMQTEHNTSIHIPSSAYFQLWVRAVSVSTEEGSLPIELVSFDATASEEKIVHLNWQTASEHNNDYFTVERSTDVKTWLPVMNVKGAGNSTMLLNYNEIDRSAPVGISYYRLKQTDFDGAFKYSDVKSVNVEKIPSSLLIYPNPSSNRIQLNCPNGTSYSISHPSGKMLISGIYQGEIDVRSFSSGVYIVQLPGQEIQPVLFRKE